MKLIRIDIFEVVLPLVHSFSTGFGTITSKPEIIVKITTDTGLVGYGEAATLAEPTYTAETADTCKLILMKHIGPRILGKSFDTPAEFREAYSDVVGNNLAKTGVELAFWHLYAQTEKRSLKSLFGGIKDEIPVGESVGIVGSIDTLIKNITELVNRGFVRIKVKIKPGWDIEPLTAIRKKWPDIDISADANASYNFAEHHELLTSLDAFNLSMLEQPLATNDFLGHAKLQKEMKTPICLDESIQNLNDAKTAIELGSCKIINIKPGRVGGILESIAIHDYAAQHDVGVWCGGMLESGIGRAFNVALASKSNFIYPADMSPQKAHYKDDITSPALELNERGCINVPDIPGLGYSINEKKLATYTVDTQTLLL
jgi:O-succinylbenzoate synthase